MSRGLINDKMLSPSFAVASGGEQFEAKITWAVISSCVMAATGGLMFGYDVGISREVTSMPLFLKEFFPDVYGRIQKHEWKETNYCKAENQGLQVFASSLYLAALTSTFVASSTTRAFGRKQTMLIAGIFFVVGTILSATADSLGMLILGRIALGCGIGFSHQAVPLFISEIAPTKIRGGLNILFQLNVTVGILFATLVHYRTSKIEGEWGWRLSLAFAGIPALLLTLGAILVDDTPNSLIERGYLEKGKSVLTKIRGTDKIEPEYMKIVKASRISQEVKHPFVELLMGQNGPPLVIAIMVQIFQQFTGINAIMFYAPILCKLLGIGTSASFYSAMIMGTVNVLSTMGSILIVDKIGRRMLLLESGVQMLVSQLMIGVILGVKVQDNTNKLSHEMAIVVLLMVCMFVSSFARSWGALGWLIPSETFPLETRSAGQSVTVCVNMVFTFLIAGSFLPMFCYMKFGVFLFFSGWVLIMWLFVWFLLPETKGIPMEEMGERVWKQHWFWKRFTEAEDEETKY